MLRKFSVLILAGWLVVAACILAPEEKPGDTPAVSDEPHAATPEPTFLTPAPSVTQTPGPALPAGFFPIAVGNGLDPKSAVLLGGTENGAWIDAATAAARLSGGEVYSLYSPTGTAGTAVGTKPTRDVICGQFHLQWNPPPSTTSLIGLGGGWNPRPRVPEDPDVPALPTYATAAGDWLTFRGLTPPDPVKLASVKRVDLDGDGTWEAIISASRLSENTLHDVAAGDFSMVLLLRESIPDTIQLAGDFFPDAKSLAFPQAYEFSSVMDLNGDGKLEIIVKVSRWEGRGILAYDFDGTSVHQIFSDICVL